MTVLSQPHYPSLSLCMIVKNEAQNLARCLHSAQAWIKEMIVVDTGSTDETIALAESLGAQASQFHWCDDFSAARNHALSLATGEWILVLDADEEWVGAGDFWNQFQPSAHTLAYQINLRDADASAGLTGMQAIRLFRNLPELRYHGRFHESLVYQGQPLSQPQISSLTGFEILHYGYSPTALAHKSQERIAFLENLRQQEGLSLMLLWTLSGFYEMTDQAKLLQSCYDEAWERLLPHLLSGEKPTDCRAVRAWMYFLATQASKQQDQETAQMLAQAGLKWFPDYPPFYYLNGLLVRLMGFVLGATPYFQACLNFSQTDRYFKGEPFDQRLITTLPAYDLGTISLEQQQFDLAVQYFKQVLNFEPDHDNALKHLAEAKSATLQYQQTH